MKPVALVTGSGKRRIGRVVAEALANRGYDIAIHYNSSAKDVPEALATLRGLGADAEAYAADIASESDVGRMFDAVAARFGRLDVLVSAAAVWTPVPLEQTTADVVLRQFSINTLGTFLCCRRAGEIMAGQPTGGSIVTIGDWATARPYTGYAAYFVSKGAIPTLTRTLAVELAARNPAVRVNCILPGPVMLPPDLSAEERNEALAGTLLKREGRPENIAQAVLFLVENDFVTGVCLPVDGGRTIASGGTWQSFQEGE